MKNLLPACLVSSCLLCGGGALGAQLPTKIFPPHAVAYEGNTISPYPFHHTQCRMQQVFERAHIAKEAALIFEFAFRRATSGTTGGYAIKGATFSNLTVRLGTTSKTVSSLSATFTANLTGTMTTVLNGTYSAPQQPKVVPPAPFNIVFKLGQPWAYNPKNGSLLLDFQHQAATRSYSGYWIDSDQRNSYGRYFVKGTTGPMANSDRPMLSFAGPFNAVPGGKVALQLAWPTKSYPATLFVGLSDKAWGATQLPVDLGLLGAPRNKLYTGPLLQMPLTFTKQSNNRYLASTSLDIPNDQLLGGWHGFFQSYLLDPPSNSLGVVFTNYAEVELGGGLALTQSVGASGKSPTTGYVNSRAPSGPVVRFSGVFN